MKSEPIPSGKVVLCIVGPTASGKTSLALLVAQSLGGEIISADSRQVYKYLNIGTAKPPLEERKELKHHFIDVLNPGEDFNAGDFGKEGRKIIEEIFQRRKTPIVVGGSGLYVQSLIDGFFEGPPKNNEVREKLYRRLHEEGADALLEQLRKVDPVSAAKMLPSNSRRIVRALEVYELTGTPLSKLQQQKIEMDFTPLIVGLEWERKILYERIDRRVDEMLENGLVDEVRKLKSMGYGEKTNALQTVGYQEVFRHLRGEIDYESMVELIKRNSRRFAKRQLTWFRRDKRIHWLAVKDATDFPAVAGKVVRMYESSLE